jgi:hypothetical protein
MTLLLGVITKSTCSLCAYCVQWVSLVRGISFVFFFLNLGAVSMLQGVLVCSHGAWNLTHPHNRCLLSVHCVLVLFSPGGSSLDRGPQSSRTGDSGLSNCLYPTHLKGRAEMCLWHYWAREARILSQKRGPNPLQFVKRPRLKSKVLRRANFPRCGDITIMSWEHPNEWMKPTMHLETQSKTLTEQLKYASHHMIWMIWSDPYCNPLSQSYFYPH